MIVERGCKSDRPHGQMMALKPTSGPAAPHTNSHSAYPIDLEGANQ